MSLSYESSGVNYDQLDAFKRACQRAARTTAGLLHDHGYAEPASTRGESAYLMEAADHYLAHVEEGLGTKNLVADAVYAATGKNFYREIALDTVATIVNDLVTCGALPISVAMHAAVGESAWFADAARMQSLVDGWAEGCRQAGAVWGGGETPTLRGIVNAATIVLAGSAVGKISPKSHRITGDVHDGDAMVFLASSGVQTNGLSLCRLIAEKLPQGYQTPLGHGDPRTRNRAGSVPQHQTHPEWESGGQHRGQWRNHRDRARSQGGIQPPHAQALAQPGQGAPVHRGCAHRSAGEHGQYAEQEHAHRIGDEHHP